MVLTEYTALFICVCALGMDLQKGRISNRFLLASLLTAAALRLFPVFCSPAIPAHLASVLSSVLPPQPLSCRQLVWEMTAGAALPVFLLGWLFRFRMMGAGDIKLLSVLGMLLGPGSVLRCIYYTLLYGSIFSIGILCANQNIRERFLYLAAYIRQYLYTRQITPYRGRWDSRSNLHMTVPVLMAVLTVMIHH